MPWRPAYPGEVPTLGFDVLDWMTEYLAAPDKSTFEAFVPTMEQAQFVINFYALDPYTGRRRYRRGVISRPKGWGKSPFLAAIACAEALAPVFPDGWDANGRPVGKLWLDVRTPWVQLLAVAEDQTRNAWAPLLEMLREGSACDEYPGLEPMETFVNLPLKGRIEFNTSAASSKEGNRPTFAILDQTEEWKPSNGGKRLAETIRRNLGKVGFSTSIESPNAYVPGEDSVAEASHNAFKLMSEGRARENGVLYDHREWPPDTDMTDKDSLMAGLAYVYGESADVNGGWVDLERLVAEIWDPDTQPQNARRYYGNAITHAVDSWVSQPEWAACTATKVVADEDVICMGFDGSRHRTDAVTDATGLVGVRVSDGFMFPLGVWEQPEGVKDWWVPTIEVDATVREAFKRFRVIGFYADPAADWRSFVAGWERDFNATLKVKNTRDHPIEWWMGGQNLTKTVRATEQMYSAIQHKELTHDGGSALTRHVLNARRRSTRVGVQIAKDFPESPRKIDLAVAGILAWQARLDAVATGALAEAQRPRSKRLVRF